VLALADHVYCGRCLDERARAARVRTRTRKGTAVKELGCSVCGGVDHNVLRHTRVQAAAGTQISGKAPGTTT
jgi:hypothetical protein